MAEKNKQKRKDVFGDDNCSRFSFYNTIMFGIFALSNFTFLSSSFINRTHFIILGFLSLCFAGVNLYNYIMLKVVREENVNDVGGVL